MDRASSCFGALHDVERDSPQRKNDHHGKTGKETQLKSTDTGDHHNVTVNGTVSDKAARVFVTGTEVPLADDGSFTTTVLLHYEETIIRVSAFLEEMEPLSTLLTVTRAY